MKIAFMTTDRETVDAHFGGAKEIDVYEVSQSGYTFLHTLDADTGVQVDTQTAQVENEIETATEPQSNVIDFAEKKESLCKHGKPNCKKNADAGQEETKKAKPTNDESDDKIARRIAVVKDCAIVYVASIGGTAAAKVIKNGIMPVTPRMDEDNIQEILNRLVLTLKGNPAPWLRKAMEKNS